MTEIILIYLIVMNFAGLITMCVDKYRATSRQWRLSEKLLLGIAVFGGSIGSILGMIMFRHKTKHIQFIVGMPLILAAQIVIAILILT